LTRKLKTSEEIKVENIAIKWWKNSVLEMILGNFTHLQQRTTQKIMVKSVGTFQLYFN